MTALRYFLIPFNNSLSYSNIQKHSVGDMCLDAVSSLSGWPAGYCGFVRRFLPFATTYRSERISRSRYLFCHLWIYRQLLGRAAKDVRLFSFRFRFLRTTIFANRPRVDGMSNRYWICFFSFNSRGLVKQFHRHYWPLCFPRRKQYSSRKGDRLFFARYRI